MTGESLMVTWFRNADRVPRRLALGSPHMGTMLSLNLHNFPGSTIVAQADAFIAASAGAAFA